MALVNFDTTNKGKRVELVYTNDDYTTLRRGSKGTYEGCLRQPDGNINTASDGTTVLY